MKFAYGSIKKINEAIEAGTIPAETLIITSDNADVAELFFYDKNKLLKKVERKNKFLTIDEAKEWAPTWGIEGDVISVKNSKGEWELGIVNSEKDIIMQSSSSGDSEGSGGVIPDETSNNFPEVGQKGKIYIDTNDQSLYLWDETSSSYILVGFGHNNLIYSGGDAYGN